MRSSGDIRQIAGAETNWGQPHFGQDPPFVLCRLAVPRHYGKNRYFRYQAPSLRTRISRRDQ